MSIEIEMPSCKTKFECVCASVASLSEHRECACARVPVPHFACASGDGPASPIALFGLQFRVCSGCGFMYKMAALAAKEDRMLEFVLNALDTPDPFLHEVRSHGFHLSMCCGCACLCQVDVTADVADALAWQAARSPEQVMQERERVVAALESRGAQLWKEGKVDEWFKGCDPRVRRVAQTVNAPLLLELARECNYHDTEVVEKFRSGENRALV